MLRARDAIVLPDLFDGGFDVLDWCCDACLIGGGWRGGGGINLTFSNDSNDLDGILKRFKFAYGFV